MAVKIGYPVKWRDYSGLAVDRDVYVLNAMQASEFDTRFDLGKIGRPVDRTQWEMTPPTVNVPRPTMPSTTAPWAWSSATS
jgi:putative endopeptidase